MGATPTSNIPTRKDLNRDGKMPPSTLFRDPDVPGQLYFIDPETGEEYGVNAFSPPPPPAANASGPEPDAVITYDADTGAHSVKDNSHNNLAQAMPAGAIEFEFDDGTTQVTPDAQDAGDTLTLRQNDHPLNQLDTTKEWTLSQTVTDASDEVRTALYAVTPRTPYLDNLRSKLTGDWQTKLDQFWADCTNYGDAALQFPFYHGSITGQAEVNAAQALGDGWFLERLFATWDKYKSAHNLTIDRDHSGGADNPAYGYSNPQVSKGASHTTYLAVQNAYLLWMMEWAASVWECVSRIVDGDFATDSQKERARGYAQWVTRHTVERYMTSSTWNDMNQLVERWADQTAGKGVGIDKYWLAGTCCAYIDYYYPLWGLSLPYFMEIGGVPSGRPRMDYQNWYRHMIGESLAQGENGPIYSNPILSGSVILGSGGSYMAPNPDVAQANRLDDVFHDARRFQFHNAIERTQKFIDGGTETRHNLHATGFREAFRDVIHQDGSGDWTTYYYMDADDTDSNPDNGRTPAWHWGRVVLGDPDLRRLFSNLTEGSMYHGLSGYDAINLGNVYSWIALAESGVEGIGGQAYTEPPERAPASAFRDPEASINTDGKSEGAKKWDTTNKRELFATGPSVLDKWNTSAGATGSIVAPISSYGIFDGVDDYVTAATPVTALPMSMSAWFKTTGDGTIVFLGDSSETAKYWRLEVVGGIASASSQSGVGNHAQGVDNVDDGFWHHICGVYATTTDRKVYVDGVEVGSNTDASNPIGHDVFEVGRSGDSTPALYFPGKITNVRLFSKALTADEVLYLATGGDSGDDPTGSGQEIFWKFNDGDGTEVADHSGNDVDGTLTNGTPASFWHPYTG